MEMRSRFGLVVPVTAQAGRMVAIGMVVKVVAIGIEVKTYL